MNLVEVTYLMGAGASAGAIPIALNLKAEIRSFVDTLIGSEVQLRPADYQEISKSQDWLDYVADVKWLMENSADKTIDEFAKDLYDRGDDTELNLVKNIVSAYFMIIQSENKLDRRYSHFLSVFADPDREVRRPKGNVKVVTWNYDSQYEIAYSLKYKSDLPTAMSQLQAFPFVNVDGRISDADIDFNKFTVVRLNGIAGLQLTPEGKSRMISFVTLTRPEAIRRALHFYKLYKHEDATHRPLMVYAWEKHVDIAEKSRKISREIMANTNVLVIIGYSFPPFNEDIDRGILRSIKNLHKVYVQDKKPDGIIEKLKRLIGADINYELITSVDNFFNPPEAAPDFIPFDADTNELLAEALLNRGELAILESDQTGRVIRAGGRNRSFFDEADPSYAARMIERLLQLEIEGIFENPRGIQYKLTGKGFKLAAFAR